uniref:Uncharacterized protein n=1 Tax=Marseillevirus LCMAC102 TaxID=2506603 RepID=A0A481YV51_9VIRU|nr:MAG: hypothetical protein LCMAC102_01810 [Marseillevirus LCMAC102]
MSAWRIVWGTLVIIQACLVTLAFLLPSGGPDIPEMMPDPLAALQNIKIGIIVSCTLIAVLPVLWIEKKTVLSMCGHHRSRIL